jgi:hypothetical protein
MSNLITVTTFTSLSQSINGNGDGAAAVAKLINVRDIVEVKTRTTAYLTTGVTDVKYKYQVNNQLFVITLIVTESQAALLTAANSNAIAT